MKNPKIDLGRFIIGFDVSPTNGDRAALAIGLTQAQCAATIRANTPAGDTEGERLLVELDSIKTEFLKENRSGVCSVFVISEPNFSAPTREISVDGAK